jgi:hypothetical protein
MNNYVLAALLALVPFGLALVFLYRKASPRPNSDFSADQCPVLSVDKYQPMGRLLREDDFRFLAAQPGFSKKMGRRFRAERRQIFRGYLRNLKKDFGRVSLALQILIVHSAEDRGNLASSLMLQRLLFALGMLAVEGRLALHAAGVGTVDVSGLVQSLQTMQDQMRLLLTPPDAAMLST